MPGEYLKGFPDPPNSPIEKFLLPQTPHLWQDDLYRDLINNGVPHELALGISRSIAQHEDRKALIEQHQKKELEWWANIHTHSGAVQPDDLESLLISYGPIYWWRLEEMEEREVDEETQLIIPNRFDPEDEATEGVLDYGAGTLMEGIHPNRQARRFTNPVLANIYRGPRSHIPLSPPQSYGTFIWVFALDLNVSGIEGTLLSIATSLISTPSNSRLSVFPEHGVATEAPIGLESTTYGLEVPMEDEVIMTGDLSSEDPSPNWIKVVLTADSDSSRLYVNGILRDENTGYSGSDLNIPSSRFILNSASTKSTGGYAHRLGGGGSSNSRTFAMQEVIALHQALDDSDVAAIWNAMLAGG